MSEYELEPCPKCGSAMDPDTLCGSCPDPAIEPLELKIEQLEDDLNFMTHNRDVFKASVARLESENRQLREALEMLLNAAPDCDCTAMDHSAVGDQHGMFAVCLPLERYVEAMNKARAALQQTKENQ